MKLPFSLGERRSDRGADHPRPRTQFDKYGSLMAAIRHLENRLTTRFMGQIFAQPHAREGMTAYFREAGNSQCNHR
jgi:hypothetical protein